MKRRTSIGVMFVSSLFVLPGAGLARCYGSGPGTVCISDYGEVWSHDYYSGGYGYGGYGYGGYGQQRGYGTARIDNPATYKAPAPNSGPPGVTGVMQPSAQTGNAWVVQPQSSIGAAVLGGGNAPLPAAEK
jgi:hypothetical protein